MDNQNSTPTSPPLPAQPSQPTPVPASTAPSHHRMKLMTLGFIGVLLLAAFGFGGYVLGQQSNNTPITPSPTGGAVACTQDAKLCPDGSAVGRVGPKCEFAACPAPKASDSADMTDWKTYTNGKYDFSIKYPSDWKYLEVPNPTYKTQTDEVWLTSNEIGFPPAQTGATPPVLIRITNTDPSDNWKPQYFNNYKSEPYQLGDISATKISGVHKEGLNQEMVIIAKIGDNYLEILSSQEETSIIDQILSTFRFTQ